MKVCVCNGCQVKICSVMQKEVERICVVYVFGLCVDFCNAMVKCTAGANGIGIKGSHSSAKTISFYE